MTNSAAGAGTPAWGWEAQIDLHGCDLAALLDAEVIAGMIKAVIDTIGMRAYGDLILKRFGQGSLHGWSAVQLIETSSITYHGDEAGRRAFLNVFSCAPFTAADAAGVAAEHLRAATAEITWRERGSQAPPAT